MLATALELLDLQSLYSLSAFERSITRVISKRRFFALSKLHLLESKKKQACIG